MFTQNSLTFIPHFYADSSGQRVTNLYDDLQVHKLIPIENPSTHAFNPADDYIFLTKADNDVHGAEMISEVDAKTGEAYFLSKGKPFITIIFPYSELVIILVMLLIVVRLLFKKKDYHSSKREKHKQDKQDKQDKEDKQDKQDKPDKEDKQDNKDKKDKEKTKTVQELFYEADGDL